MSSVKNFYFQLLSARILLMRLHYGQEKKKGWETQFDCTQSEIDWCTRELARYTIAIQQVRLCFYIHGPF